MIEKETLLRHPSRFLLSGVAQGPVVGGPPVVT